MDVVQTLATLLHGSGARPVFSRNHLPPSTIYDLHYRIAINACVFERHARTHLGVRRIRPEKLKLLQFVAMRPWLVPAIAAWSTAKGENYVLLTSHVRRGYLADTMHEKVVDFLVAQSFLQPVGEFFAAGKRAAILTAISDAAVGNNLFVAAREALEELARTRITGDMLEGL